MAALRTRHKVVVGRVWPANGPRALVASANWLRSLRADFSGYDVVHAYSSWPAGLYARMSGNSAVPLLIHEHLSPRCRLLELPVRDCLEKAVVAVPSDGYAKWLWAYFNARPHVVPNPVRAIDVPASTRRTLNVLAFGRFVPQKGFDLFCQAAVGLRYSGLRFLLAGSGPEEWRLRRIARHGAVSFLPPFQRHELPALLEQADIVCCPSRHESFGLACAEAVAAGIPVVATDVGCHAELTCGQTCTQAGLAEAITSTAGRILDERERFAECRDVVRSRYCVDRFLEESERSYALAASTVPLYAGGPT